MTIHRSTSADRSKATTSKTAARPDGTRKSARWGAPLRATLATATRALLLGLVLAVGFAAPSLASFPIDIVTDAHPNVYVGQWAIPGQTTTYLSGNQTIQLVPGSYSLAVGNRDGFSFVVSAAGTVSSSDPAGLAAAAFVGNDIILETSTVAVDPGAYPGLWAFARNGSEGAGPRVVTTVPGLSWQVNVGNADNFTIDVAADGTVTSQSPDVAEGDPSPVGTGAGTLTFRNAAVAVDPGAYPGEWVFAKYGPYLTGAATLTVVPGLTWQVNIGNAAGLVIDVAGDGTVTSAQNPTAAVGGAGSLTFSNTTVDIVPGPSAASWQIARVTSGSTSALVTLVPNLQYQVNVHDGIQLSSDLFFLSDPCADVVLADFPPGSGDDFTIGCASTAPVVSCVGFDAPLDLGPVTVRGHRALPLKAELVDQLGAPLDDLDLDSAPVLQVLFSPATGGDPVDVTDAALPAGHGTEGNQFEFVDGRWRYNLKTGGYTAEGSYEISLVSGSSEEYLVDPRCTGIFVRE